MEAKNSLTKMEFGMRIARNSILKEIKNGCTKNLVVSPLSLHIALNMLASGSTGKTLEQLLEFLESDSITQLNAQSSFLMELATGDDLPSPDDSTSGPMICLVNGLWIAKSNPLKQSFKQLAEDVYKANAQSVDFLHQARQVTDEINSWAREASKGHIDPLFNYPISGDAILVLANALYFKGTWVNKFYPDSTREEDFHLLNGNMIRIPFMKKYNAYNFYGSFEGFKLVKMPYESRNSDTKSYAMYIFLPDRRDGLQELVEKFNSDPRFFQENRKLQYVKLNNLWLPKLKYEYELKALDSMKELGLVLPFDGVKAEINEMVHTSRVVCVSDAIHKSYIEVNEEGTVAAAVTAFFMSFGSASPSAKRPPEINFVADHPFLFMIKEEISDIALFVGAALNPLA